MKTFIIGLLMGGGLVLAGGVMVLDRYFVSMANTEDIIQELVQENEAYRKVIAKWERGDM